MAVTETDQVDAPIGPTTIAQRLTASSHRLEELLEAARIEKIRRDELIVTGYDEGGLSHRDLAHYARVSKSRIIAILGGG